MSKLIDMDSVEMYDYMTADRIDDVVITEDHVIASRLSPQGVIAIDGNGMVLREDEVRPEHRRVYVVEM